MTLNLRHLLTRSLLHRRARSLSALVALTVSAAITTALLTLYADIDAKLHHEFRSFGANIVLTAPVGSSLPPGIADRVRQIAGPDSTSAAFAYAVATTDRGSPVVVAGTDFADVQRLDSWWSVAAWPTGPDAALIGARAANFIADEHAVTLTWSGRSITLHGAGQLHTGGEEDSRIYIPFTAFTALTRTQPGSQTEVKPGSETRTQPGDQTEAKPGNQASAPGPTVLELQVPGSAGRIESTITRLRQDLPGLGINPVRQLVEGESRIVDRTHALMFAAVLLIALTVAVSVLATLSASVLERRRDFALMKALGAAHRQLLSLFLLEAVTLALAGVLAGWILGSAAAWVISEIDFNTSANPRPGVLPLVLLLNLLIAGAAALFPARVLRGLQPAALLKGE